MYSYKQTDARKIRLAIAIMVAALVPGAYNDSPADPHNRGSRYAGDMPRTKVPEVLVGRWESNGKG